jgi:phage host-nuclease inhibitor protein Gam
MDIKESYVINEGFIVDSDQKCEWCIKKIKAAEDEYVRLMELVQAERKELDLKAEELSKHLESETGYLKGLLFKYFETVEKKETKTQQSYKLLSGSLVLRKPSVKIVKPDETKLVEFLEANGYEKFVQTKKSAAWGEFKKEVEIKDGQVILDDTGEVLDWIDTEEDPGKFEVK